MDSSRECEQRRVMRGGLGLHGQSRVRAQSAEFALGRAASGAGAAQPGIRLSPGADTGVLSIRNQGTLPSKLDFDFESGAGLGTGLSRVRLLLKPGASHLTFERTPSGLMAALHITSASL